MSEQQGYEMTSRGHKPHAVLRIVIPLLLVAAAVVGAIALVKTKSKPKKRPPQERVAIVEIQELKLGRGHVRLRTTGTVMPSRAVFLQARVAGQIVRTDPRFIPGGRFRAGEIMLEIDPVDYQLAVTNYQGGLAKAEYECQVEEGMQDVARHEWEALRTMQKDRLFDPLDKSLALREPHLRLVRANLGAARAQFAQAKLNLERTKVRAPFNAVVRSRSVNLGSQVAPQTPLAELAGTDTCWILATLPASQAHWMTAADETTGTGSYARITSVPGIDLQAGWDGHVLRSLPDLEPAGRQTQCIIEIPNPDQPAHGKGVLPLGAYVRVAIEGPDVDEVFVIPHRALREGKDIWIMNGDNRLETRPVDVIWSDGEHTFLRGAIEQGARLVVSNISTPLSGMLLTTVEIAKQQPDSGGGARP